MQKSSFSLERTSKHSAARIGRLRLPHGEVSTPVFMPIATRGAVKGISTPEIEELGSEIILSNTYHLMLRPGVKLLKKYQGLHTFMQWSRPILTDSGGYQVFSLAQHRKITSRGVAFSDPQTGQKFFLSPEEAMRIQDAIGSDIQMVLDDCPAYPCSYSKAEASLGLTLDWAKRSKRAFEKLQKNKKHHGMVFGIIQGSTHEKLRQHSAREMVKIGFDGYAIGGVAVGEPRQFLHSVLKWTIPHLPASAPRYLMGLGKPEELVASVAAGVDMFDCVIPTREARHGRLYRWDPKVNFEKWLKIPQSKKFFYTTIDIGKAKYANSLEPINNENLSTYTLAYLHHLFRTNEMLGVRLATLNNLSFYLGLMKKLRHAIIAENL